MPDVIGWVTANWIEALGFATGIASGWLSARQHVAAWPVGIISDSNRLLFCATDALATAIWNERYLGSFSAATSAASRSDRYDLVLLADNDFPWTDDGTRNSSTVRHAMQRRFRDQLTAVWP